MKQRPFQKSFDRMTANIIVSIKSQRGISLPPIISDDTPADEAQAIRSGHQPGDPPIIRFRGVSMAEYTAKEGHLD